MAAYLRCVTGIAVFRSYSEANVMELLIVAATLTLLAEAAVLGGTDSRPRLDDEPHRSI